jgi:hypothetical protein
MRWVFVVFWLVAAAVLGAAQASAHADHDDRSAAHHDDADHDRGHEHNPADHQHPLGDDPFHQMAAHGMPDAAAHHEPLPQGVRSSVALAFPLTHVRAEGIALAPPVPPPLA